MTSVNVRTLLAAVMWILNIVAVLVHILTFNIIPVVYSKLIYAYSCAFSLGYVSVDLLKGYVSELHRGFIILTLSSLSLFFIFLILYYQFGVEDYKAKIGVFLLTEFITICFVTISGLKLGLFNNAKDML